MGKFSQMTKGKKIIDFILYYGNVQKYQVRYIKNYIKQKIKNIWAPFYPALLFVGTRNSGPGFEFDLTSYFLRHYCL